MITVYGKPGCTQCDQAKTLSVTRGLDYHYIELDLGQNKDSSMEYISRENFFMLFPNAKTVPQIVIDNQHIGGLREFQQYLKGKKDDSV